MVILSVSQLTKSFGPRTLFQQVSFSVNAGDRMGIVGANGTGKTTLFAILCGDTPFDTGNLFVPGHIQLGVQHQMPEIAQDQTVEEYVLSVFQPLLDLECRLRQMEKAIARSHEGNEGNPSASTDNEQLETYAQLLESFEGQNGYGYRSEVRGVLNGLGFYGEDMHQPADTLSGGQKTRLTLSRLLLTKPDVLLLDEPTNHLDIESVEWLENFLRSYAGTCLIISHDRYFLDQVTTQTLELNQEKSVQYQGSYTEALRKKAALEAAQQKQNDKQTREMKRQELIVRRMKQHGTEKLANRAKSREKKLAKMATSQSVNKPAVLSGLSFEADQTSGRHVLTGEKLTKGWPGQPFLFQSLDFSLERGDRTALVGPNGIGKTTLFRIAAGELAPDEGTVALGHQVSLGYYHQELQDLDPSKTVIDSLHDAYPHLTQTQLRTHLGSFLFQGDDVFSHIHQLSGGEKARLSLLILMLAGHNLLLLDEPTNHLDIPARENLEEALLRYEGTLFFISHDRYFINKIATSVMVFSPEGLTRYLGNFDDYQEKQRQLEMEMAVKDSSPLNRTQKKWERQKEQQKRDATREHKRKIQELEESITQLEKRLHELDDALCQPEVYQDAEQGRLIHAEKNHLHHELENKYRAWEELAASSDE